MKKKIEQIKEEVIKCTKCELSETRTNSVPGKGNFKSDVIFVGEAPGKNEDMKGEPFIGVAGNKLSTALESAGISRNEVYITNIVKCRPPKNRDPLPTEVKECEPYLLHQINLIKPKLIVALGRVAGMTLLNVDNSLKSMRGQIHDYNGTKLIVTYHPAALLRNPNWKPEAWKDFKWIRSIID